VRTDIKARKFCSANPFHDSLEGTRLSHGPVVECCAPREFDGEKQPGIRVEFMNALTKAPAIGVQENIAASRVQRERHAANFGVV
jgi:hypothetical protein